MKIAIVEDSRRDAETLTKLLNEYQKAYSFQLSITYYPSGEDFTATLYRENYHLIFLDMYMKKMDGIETAENAGNLCPNALIVFLTVSREDIWRAVRLHSCFDYVEKENLTISRLTEILHDARQKLKLQASMLEFYSGRQKVNIPLAQIQYLVSRNKYIGIIFENGSEASYRITFSAILELLKNEHQFLLCNRGILLNMDFIVKTDYEIFEMRDGAHFPLRRSNRTQIVEQYNNYQFEKLNK